MSISEIAFNTRFVQAHVTSATQPLTKLKMTRKISAKCALLRFTSMLTISWLEARVLFLTLCCNFKPKWYRLHVASQLFHSNSVHSVLRLFSHQVKNFPLHAFGVIYSFPILDLQNWWRLNKCLEHELKTICRQRKSNCIALKFTCKKWRNYHRTCTIQTCIIIIQTYIIQCAHVLQNKFEVIAC